MYYTTLYYTYLYIFYGIVYGILLIKLKVRNKSWNPFRFPDVNATEETLWQPGYDFREERKSIANFSVFLYRFVDVI